MSLKKNTVLLYVQKPIIIWKQRVIDILYFQIRTHFLKLLHCQFQFLLSFTDLHLIADYNRLSSHILCLIDNYREESINHSHFDTSPRTHLFANPAGAGKPHQSKSIFKSPNNAPLLCVQFIPSYQIFVFPCSFLFISQTHAHISLLVNGIRKSFHRFVQIP